MEVANDRPKEVQPIQGFDLRQIRMKKHNSCSQHHHNWDKALMMMLMSS